MQTLSPSQVSPEVPINENFDTLSGFEVYGKNHPSSTGLTWGYYGGRWGGLAVAAGTLTLANSSTNYLMVLRSTGAISTSTSATNWNNPALYARVYKLTTAGSVVTATEDHRAGLFGAHGDLPPPAAVTVASAATIAIPLGQRVVIISGTAGISSCTQLCTTGFGCNTTPLCGLHTRLNVGPLHTRFDTHLRCCGSLHHNPRRLRYLDDHLRRRRSLDTNLWRPNLNLWRLNLNLGPLQANRLCTCECGDGEGKAKGERGRKTMIHGELLGETAYQTAARWTYHALGYSAATDEPSSSSGASGSSPLLALPWPSSACRFAQASPRAPL